MAQIKSQTETEGPVSLPRITPDEWRRVALVAALIFTLTTIPYLYAYLSTPADKQFMGIMLDVPDHAQYFSWMRELSQANLSSNKLTPEANQPIFFNLLWWGLGRLSQIVGPDYMTRFAVAFQLLRVFATLTFFPALYRLCAWAFPEKGPRFTAFLIATLTSGLGWVLVVLKYTVTGGELLFPLDVFIAEGNTFLGLLGYPHFIAAALYIVVFDLVLLGEAKRQWRYAVAAGLFALFLGWQHAYDLISVYGVLGAYGALRVLRDRRWPTWLIGCGLLVGVLSWWPALYSVWLTSADPIWKQILKQFVNAGVFTPGLLHLPLLLGITFLLALFTALVDRPWRLRGVGNVELLVRGWFWVTFGLIYLPVEYQIHLLNGWQVPMAILAARGLFTHLGPALAALGQRFGQRWGGAGLARWLPVLLLVIILPTNLYLWTWRFVDLARHDYPFYFSRDEVAALRWLEQNADPEAVVLSSLTVGQYLPAWTGTRAFLAHWAQTLDFFGKSKQVELFFGGEPDTGQRQALLRQYHIDYVFYGPVEQHLGAYNPATALFLEPVGPDWPAVKIYKVKLP